MSTVVVDPKPLNDLTTTAIILGSNFAEIARDRPLFQNIPDAPGSPLLEISDSSGRGLAHVHPTCGICGELFQLSESPLSTSVSANSEKDLPFGLRLPCPNQHTYCVWCLSQYIISKLDPHGTGAAPEDQTVFPICCPECLPNQWADGVPDIVAERILTKDRMILWYQRKILDSHPWYYCPNRHCSALLELHETGELQAKCPLCKIVVCVPCKTEWHTHLTCEQYQAIPPDMRSLEDRLLLQLAKKRKWRRCKCCGRIIERRSGCDRVVCPCGSHFCFKCGADWDQKHYQCSRGETCNIWIDDAMLVEQHRRKGIRYSRLGRIAQKMIRWLFRRGANNPSDQDLV